MTIILFTLVEVDLTFNQRFNPYLPVGFTNNSGLDYIGTHLTSNIIPALATGYMVSTYSTNTVYPQELYDTVTAQGANVAMDASKNLSGIDLNGGYNALVQKVFSFIDKFPAFVDNTTLDQSYVIFNNTGTGGTGLNQIQSQWNLKTTNLLNEILDSGLSTDQQVLPLVALSILTNCYAYWQAVYYNTSGSNVWHTSLLQL